MRGARSRSVLLGPLAPTLTLNFGVDDEGIVDLNGLYVKPE